MSNNKSKQKKTSNRAPNRSIPNRKGSNRQGSRTPPKPQNNQRNNRSAQNQNKQNNTGQQKQSKQENNILGLTEDNNFQDSLSDLEAMSDDYDYRKDDQSTIDMIPEDSTGQAVKAQNPPSKSKNQKSSNGNQNSFNNAKNNKKSVNNVTGASNTNKGNSSLPSKQNDDQFFADDFFGGSPAKVPKNTMNSMDDSWFEASNSSGDYSDMFDSEDSYESQSASSSYSSTRPKLRLIWMDGTRNIESGDVVIVGSVQADILIPRRIHDAPTGVSGRHAMITEENGFVWIEDLGSRNGVHLNGAPIRPYSKMILRDGDDLKIGAIHFSVERNTAE